MPNTNTAQLRNMQRNYAFTRGWNAYFGDLNRNHTENNVNDELQREFYYGYDEAEAAWDKHNSKT